MELMFIALAFVGGYVASIFTWDKIHTVFVGIVEKERQLRIKLNDLQTKLRG